MIGLLLDLGLPPQTILAAIFLGGVLIGALIWPVTRIVQQLRWANRISLMGSVAAYGGLAAIVTVFFMKV